MTKGMGELRVSRVIAIALSFMVRGGLWYKAGERHDA